MTANRFVALLERQLARDVAVLGTLALGLGRVMDVHDDVLIRLCAVLVGSQGLCRLA